MHHIAPYNPCPPQRGVHRPILTFRRALSSTRPPPCTTEVRASSCLPFSAIAHRLYAVTPLIASPEPVRRVRCGMSPCP